MLLKSNFECVRMIRGIVILPTVNKLTPDQGKILSNDDAFKENIKKGKFEVVDIPKQKKSDINLKIEKAETISEVVFNSSPKEAKKIISDLLDVRELVNIVNEDSRPSIVKAAQKKLDEMEVGKVEKDETEK